MNYLTIDALPDLSAEQMASAHVLTFQPYGPFGDPSVVQRDNTIAYFQNRGKTAFDHVTFAFDAVQDRSYSLSSDNNANNNKYPFLVLQLYDRFGNVVAYSNDNLAAKDMIRDFVAPYSGKFYITPGWDKSPFSSALSIAIHGDAVRPVGENVIGTAADDRLTATAKNENIDGGAGTDTVVYKDPQVGYSLVKHGAELRVQAGVFADLDILTNIEKIEFNGKPLTITYNDLAQSLYIAYFGRAADPKGLASFQDQLIGMGAPRSANELAAKYALDPAIKGLIDSFGLSAESKLLYQGDSKSFVDAIFHNVLNRAPAESGLKFWSEAIDSGVLTRANASLSIMAGAQSNTSAQGLLDSTTVANKIDVASTFTFALDTLERAAAYSGSAAAAAARGLLASVTNETDVMYMHAPITAAINTISAPRTSGDLNAPERAGHSAAAIELVGVPSADGWFDSL
ncbi:DUF4214 domain-containing protein [Massilia scottii]|uniref:DUF4214 domain-containing protein n=1 Tax=Massilia scottii TaxID=3057166 RepID=UPI0027969426|nr:DUF4214 domain-containing protein [Massilia sp. CCM 9029]MDQ1831104.1 DUF4214 domain-containing protein [Massilia sp. CCM 9029]